MIGWPCACRVACVFVSVAVCWVSGDYSRLASLVVCCLCVWQCVCLCGYVLRHLRLQLAGLTRAALPVCLFVCVLGQWRPQPASLACGVLSVRLDVCVCHVIGDWLALRELSCSCVCLCVCVLGQ